MEKSNVYKYIGENTPYYTKNNYYKVVDYTSTYVIMLDDSDTSHHWDLDVFNQKFTLPTKELTSNHSKQFKEITDKMVDTYIKKNHDYGNSFDASMDEEGFTAARIRLGDKWLRFKKLSKGEKAKVKDESIKDTLLDMANYCIMTVMWMDKQDKVCQE